MIRRTLALLAIVLAGCAGVDIADYRDEKPALDLARYFDGPVDGWGMVQDRCGAASARAARERG